MLLLLSRMKKEIQLLARRLLMLLLLSRMKKEIQLLARRLLMLLLLSRMKIVTTQIKSNKLHITQITYHTK